MKPLIDSTDSICPVPFRMQNGHPQQFTADVLFFMLFFFYRRCTNICWQFG